MASSTLSIWQHIRESVRLLYWIFLKPFTLKQYLSKIHPGLEPDDDPFKHKDEFDSNLALKRYAEHGWWLSIAAPAGALLLSACITLLITRTFVNIPFNASMAVGFSLSPLVRRYRWRAIGILAVVLIVGVAVGVAFGVSFILGVIRAYFWLFELLWMGMLFLTTPEHRDASRLNLLPFWFNEKRFLPLPFLDRFILAAYRDSPTPAQAAIDYLISSTNQQALAARVMVKISAVELGQCQSIAEIAAVADHLAWIPSPPPKELGTALPEFVGVSQSVRAAQEATSLYRQRELLNRPIAQLKSLRESLALSRSATVATTFRPIAQAWLAALETAQRTLQDRAHQLGEVPQVYIAGPRLDVVSAGDRFKGRQDLFREIESLTLAAQPPTLLLYGGRRTGKSSMLSYLPRRVGAEIVPLHVDLQMAASATTLRGIAESIVNLMVEAAHKARNIRLPYPDEDAIHRDPFPAMERWFAEIERAIRGKRFLLCLDEFERLEEVVRETGSRAPLNFFRYVLQNRPQWILLFSGSHTLNELEPYWSDYLINTRPIRVSYLQEADARELIQKPVPEFPDIYEPDAVDAILRLTHCQPYLVQLTCSTLIDHLNRGGNPQDKRVTRQDIEAVKNEILEQASANLFKDRYRTLTDAEQQCLEQLIHHPTADSTDRRSLKRLVQEREVLQRTGTRFSFQVPLFELYVRSRYDFDDVPLA